MRALIIMERPPSTCEDCGNWAECRPYGKDWASVCYRCASKNKRRMRRAMERLAAGDAPPELLAAYTLDLPDDLLPIGVTSGELN